MHIHVLDNQSNEGSLRSMLDRDGSSCFTADCEKSGTWRKYFKKIFSNYLCKLYLICLNLGETCCDQVCDYLISK